jgi:nucleotide-binding universal stress UspA family protein
MLKIRTILHPTDFYTSSDYAFRLACALASDHQARLVPLHVVTSSPVAMPTEVMTDERFDSYTQHLWTALQRLRAPDARVPVEHRLAVGDPATEILKLAAEIRADLIVMGTHGRSGLGRLLLGSVAEGVLREAPCPVLTVHEPVCGAHSETALEQMGNASPGPIALAGGSTRKPEVQSWNS